MAGKTASGKSGKGAAKKSAAEPQLRKDPAFMKRMEAAIRDEYRKGGTAAPAADAPALQPASRAKDAAPGPAPEGTPARATAAAPAAPAVKKARRSTAARKALADELSSLLPGLDEEGLAFLIEQARTHLYNMKVLELEAEAERLEASSARSRTLSSARGAARPAGGGFSIKAGEGGTDYSIVRDGKWKMFTREEMLAMVRIATVREPLEAVAPRLYRWLKAERSDFFGDIPVSGPSDPALASLAKLLRATFEVRK